MAANPVPSNRTVAARDDSNAKPVLTIVTGDGFDLLERTNALLEEILRETRMLRLQLIDLGESGRVSADNGDINAEAPEE